MTVTSLPPTRRARRAASARVRGVDAARALAIIGMVLSHLVYVQGIGGELIQGFPSAAFAMLAGVSLGFMKADTKPGRQRTMIRGVLLVVLHFLLAQISGPIAVVLFATGTCFILLPWLAAARTITLVVSAVWLAVLSTGIAFYEFAAGYMGLNLPQLPPNISAPYPLAAWAAYMLMGLITYRVLLTNQRAQIGTALVGSVLAAAGIALRRSLDFEQLMSLGSTPPAWLGLLNPLPHSGTFVDVAISGAGALALLSLCLLLAQGQWVYPLAAMGSMSLTAYIAHIVSFAAVLGVSGGYSEPLAWATILVLLIFASLWQHFLGRGPAEYALTAAVRALQPKEKKHA